MIEGFLSGKKNEFINVFQFMQVIISAGAAADRRVSSVAAAAAVAVVAVAAVAAVAAAVVAEVGSPFWPELPFGEPAAPRLKACID
jgi:tartrate dehydratase beta subunit/fumarate hydratase class I family protein